jgi:hypothetical protein
MLHARKWTHTIQFPQYLCDCYMLFYRKRTDIIQLSQCYVSVTCSSFANERTLSSSHNVYVNVTRYSIYRKWTHIIQLFPQCLCERYMLFYRNERTLSSSHNVYVNVTRYSIYWKWTHIIQLFPQCLCECYMLFYRKWTDIIQFPLFMWMLHAVL